MKAVEQCSPHLDLSKVSLPVQEGRGQLTIRFKQLKLASSVQTFRPITLLCIVLILYIVMGYEH